MQELTPNTDKQLLITTINYPEDMLVPEITLNSDKQDWVLHMLTTSIEWAELGDLFRTKSFARNDQLGYS